MKFQDSSFNGLKVTVGTESVTHPRTHALTDAPKAICPINFFKVGGIIKWKLFPFDESDFLFLLRQVYFLFSFKRAMFIFSQIKKHVFFFKPNQIIKWSGL